MSSLRYVIDEVDKHFRSLAVLDQTINQYIIVSVVRSKLPEDVLLHLEVQKGVNEIWTVRTLSKRLSDYIVARVGAFRNQISKVVVQIPPYQLQKIPEY